ncbi:MAG TPA: hypothetical protein VJR47_06420 [Stellaceae bacterium]|nr:hypothetical protein [Stellaceae bacterium]
MRRPALCLALLALLAGAGAPAWAGAKAKTTSAQPQQTASAPADAKSAAPPQHYRDLAPADRKIVHALFEAQLPTAEGPPPLNLDQIAALKEKTGWEPAFKRMKADGLVSAKTLRQLIGAPAHGARMLPTPWPDAMAMNTAGGRAVK